MIKKLLTLTLISGLLFACTNTPKEAADQSEETLQIAELTIAEIIADPEAHVDKDIKISGTVSHVCKHGGKRMFVFGDNPDDVLLIVPAEGMPAFSAEDEGSSVEIVGNLIVNKIDEEYLLNMESEMEAGNEVEDRQIHDHSEGELSGEEGHEHAEGEGHEHGEDQEDGEEHGEGEGPDDDTEEHQADPNAAKRNYIAQKRAEIAESEKGYVVESFFECKEYKTVETVE